MSDSAGHLWLDVAQRATGRDELLAATGLSRAADAEALRRHRRRPARSAPSSPRRWGMTGAAGRGRRRRRQCRVGLRRRRRSRPGTRLRLARHLGRALRLQRPLLAQSGRRGPCLLPCGAGHLAPDGRDPLGRRQPRMAGRRPRQRRRRADRRRSAATLDGPGRRHLPALSLAASARRTTTPRSAALFVGLEPRDRPHGADPVRCSRASPSPSRDCLAALQRGGHRRRARARRRRRLALALWLRIIATYARHRRSTCPRTAISAAAFGAARLGLIAADGADPFEVCAPPKIRETIEPDPKLARRPMRDAYARYRELYPAIKEATAAMTARFFDRKEPDHFEGPTADNALAFRWYDPNQMVLGKRMEDHLRFAVCYWHSLRLAGRRSLRRRDLQAAVDAHGRSDGGGAHQGRRRLRDVRPPRRRRSSASTTATSRPKARSLKEFEPQRPRDRRHLREEDGDRQGTPALGHGQPVLQPPLHGGRGDQSRSGCLRLCRGAGEERASTLTHELGGANYVLWGGREGYETLLNTDIKHELDQLGRFLVDGRRLQAQDRLQGHDPDRAEAAGADQAPVRLRRRHGLRLPQGASASRRRSRSTSSRTTPSSPATPSSTSSRSPPRSASSARSTSTATTISPAGTPTSSP